MAQSTDQPEDDFTPRRKSKGRRPLDIDALSKRDRERLEKRGKSPKRLKEIELVIKRLVKIKMSRGSLRGTGERNKAAKALDVSIWTIDNWADAYLADPRVESLADKQPGREKGRMLSADQEDIACFFFINPDLKTVYPDGIPDNIPQIADTKYIYAVIQKFCPEPTWTIDTLRRYLNDLKSEHPLVITRAHKGEAYLRNKLLPARKNNVDRPNQRWQMDARPLPIYINYDGMICTVTLLQMIDDYSWYPVRHRIIPRKIRDDEGLPKGADFTSGDVGILLASAMYYERIRPEDLYTDNGSQIIAIEEFLEDLTDENETLIRMRNSIPGRPRGRGKIEKFLGLMDELLKDLPANFVGKEKDLAAVGAARRVKNMLTFEHFCTIFDEYIEEVRKRPRNKKEKKGRDQIWRSMPALPAPPIRRLKVLTPQRIDTHVAVNTWKIVFDKQEYEPRITTANDMYRWMLAAARPEFVSLHGAKLDAGWALEVCLDGENWNECVLKSVKQLSDDKYNQFHNAALKRIREEHAEIFTRVQDAAQRVGADRARKHVVTKQPTLPEELPQQPADAPKTPPAGVSTPHPEHGRSPSLKPARRQQPLQATMRDKQTADLGAMPDVAELMRQLEQEIERERSERG